jgi:predicted nucleic acid-binding protein
MRVVSNTSPISNLAIIGRLYLLRQHYRQVLVPPEVARESPALTHSAGRRAIQAALDEGWLSVEPIPSPSLALELRKSLDPGKADRANPR